MRFKVVVLALVALFATSAIASAQSQTGEIFGKVTDGMDIVDAIRRVPTTTRAGHENVPTDPVVIRSIRKK